MDSEIKKGIPLPSKMGPAKSLKRLQIEELQVGDMRFIDATRSSISTMLTDITYKTGNQYATRMIDGRLGVWRIR